jgi:hypothetical protein
VRGSTSNPSNNGPNRSQTLPKQVVNEQMLQTGNK